MTIASTYKTTANLDTEQVLATDVWKYIYRIGEPSEAPLIALCGGVEFSGPDDQKGKKVPGKIQKEVATEVKYNVIEKDLLSRTATVATAVADTTTTTVAFSSAANLRVGDIVKNTSQFDADSCGSEVMRIDAISTNSTTAKRNIGSTTFTIAAGDVFLILGNAIREGGPKPSMRSQLAEERERRVQILKRAYGVTGTAEEVELLLSGANKPMDEEFIQAQIEHRKDIEYSFWCNPGADSTTDTDSYTVNLTRGIIAELNGVDRDIDCSGLTEDKFFGEVSEKIFEYGNHRKMAFFSPTAVSLISTWARTKLQMSPADTTYGIKINQLETNHGILEWTMLSGFSSFFPAANAAFVAVLDLPYVRYKYINNRDTKVVNNTNTPGDDVQERLLFSEVGLSLRVMKAHTLLKNFKA